MKEILLLLIILYSISVHSQNQSESVGFRENKGQIINQNGRTNNAVKYLLALKGLNVQLRKNGFSYDVYEIKNKAHKNFPSQKNQYSIFPEKNSSAVFGTDRK